MQFSHNKITKNRLTKFKDIFFCHKTKLMAFKTVKKNESS